MTIAVILARMTEFFDFFVYALASALVFPYVFFSFADPLTATLYSFAVFSLAFIARPIGSLVFLQIDRKFGRAVKLTAALFTLCGSTMAISFLPSFAEAGIIAPVLLAVFRFGQGLGLGGAWDGLVSLLAMNAPAKQRGWYAMMPQIGAAMGFGLASAFFIIFVTQLSTPEFLAWGWRFPFFVALALNVLALFARLRMIVTPEFQAMLEQHELEPKPMFEMLRNQSRVVFTGAFVPLASFALFHLVTVFPISWVTLNTNQRLSDFLFVQFVSAIIGGGMIVLSGVLADRIGRRKLLGIAAVLIGIFSFIAPVLLGAGDIGRYLFVLIGFSLLGLSFGQAGGALASRFSREYRYTGASLTSDISWLIGAGFAPLVALGFSSKFGLFAVGLYLLSGAICTLVALLFSRTLDMPSE
ncbi:MHS family MFS transporter [Agrobacterium tumefaciens]|nr:MHS family MFS transporter [Agrobacterium tumefaciens]